MDIISYLLEYQGLLDVELTSNGKTKKYKRVSLQDIQVDFKKQTISICHNPFLHHNKITKEVKFKDNLYAGMNIVGESIIERDKNISKEMIVEFFKKILKLNLTYENITQSNDLFTYKQKEINTDTKNQTISSYHYLINRIMMYVLLVNNYLEIKDFLETDKTIRQTQRHYKIFFSNEEYVLINKTIFNKYKTSI